LREYLNAKLSSDPDASSTEPSSDAVVFIDGDKNEPISFAVGAISELLINVEEERTLRPADRFARQAEDGSHLRGQPDIRLILYVLFVARFKKYDLAWTQLSKVIEQFQAVPRFDSVSTPSLPAGIEMLNLELVTLRFAEQNEVWNALRATYHPSILYRVKLVTLRDRNAIPVAKIAQAILNTTRIS
jgi:Pvc16 N-terminal domain